MRLRPLRVGAVDGFPEFKLGGLVAIRAAEPVFEQDGQGHPQPVAAQERPGAPVFHAGFRCEHRSPAQGATGAGCRDPLGGDENQAENDKPRTNHRPLVIGGHQ